MAAARQLSGVLPPALVMELWGGWFDYWARPHSRVGVAAVAAVVDVLLAAGASFNLYMAHGGTNFGAWLSCSVEQPLGSIVVGRNIRQGGGGVLTAGQGLQRALGIS